MTRKVESNLCSKIKSIIDFVGKRRDIYRNNTDFDASYNLYNNIKLRYIDETLIVGRDITFYIEICNRPVFSEYHTYYNNISKPTSIANKWADDLISKDEKQKLIKLIDKKYNELKLEEEESEKLKKEAYELEQEQTKKCISTTIDKCYNESVI